MIHPFLLSESLDENLEFFHSFFQKDHTIKTRIVLPASAPAVKIGIVFVDGMVNDRIINDHIIAPLLKLRKYEVPVEKAQQLLWLSRQVLSSDDAIIQPSMETLLDALLCGDTILFVDGCDKGISLSSKNWPLRSVTEPDGEHVISGPHEGFTESLMQNLSMIRRRITNPALSYEFFQLGRKSKTTVCLCSVRGLADHRLLDELRTRIQAVDIDILLDTEYLDEIIRDGRYALFRTTGSTQRPDVAAAKLLEGRAVLLCNGSPSATTLPFVFLEYFHTPDDYYSDAYYATFNRFLRFAGFFMTISLPAVYLSLVTFHPEMLPLKMLLSAAQSRSGMPMSSFCELTALILIFEIIREGSGKIPSNIGTAFSIVGGIVLGQASVDARFVSLPMVIIVAFTCITGMIVPRLKGPVLFMRFFLLFLAQAAGLFGYLLGMLILLFSICSLDSFSVPYTSATVHDRKQFFADTFFRLPWPMMKKRPRIGHTPDIHRQSE